MSSTVELHTDPLLDYFLSHSIMLHWFLSSWYRHAESIHDHGLMGLLLMLHLTFFAKCTGFWSTFNTFFCPKKAPRKKCSNLLLKAERKALELMHYYNDDNIGVLKMSGKLILPRVLFLQAVSSLLWFCWEHRWTNNWSLCIGLSWW